MKTVSRVKTGREAKKHQKLEWENGEKEKEVFYLGQAL